MAQLLLRRLQQTLPKAACLHPKSLSVTPAFNSSTKTPQTEKDEEKLTNEPIKYFGSEASAWRAKDSRSGGADKSLWYQPYVISASLAIFLVYFCILREENDIDRKLEGSLYDKVDGLEEMQLVISYKYNRENGLDTREIEKRLNELGIDVKQISLTD